MTLPTLSFTPVATFRGGGAEVVAQLGARFFVTNEADARIDVFETGSSEPIATIPLGDLPRYGGVTSVAAAEGAVAVAVDAAAVDDAPQRGFVALFDPADLSLMNIVTVGFLPDNVVFSTDGSELYTANEGEASGGVDPEGSVSIVRFPDGFRGSADVAEVGFGGLDGFDALLEAAQVRLFPDVAPSSDFEPEYIAVDPATGRLFVTLQEANAVAVIDPAEARLIDIHPMGVRDHSVEGFGIDPSDADGGPSTRLAPVSGLPMPDAIASFTVGDVSYYVTANEGDARDEDARIASLTLDPTAFPDAATLQQDDKLGRLQVSTIDGDPDGDGDFDQLFSYGSRSISIFDADGRLVFDSGDAIETFLAANFPDNYAENRSDNKGPEPEGVTVAEIDGRVIAFVALERSAGVIAFDVSDPATATIVGFANGLVIGDIAPETLIVVPEDESGTGAPQLVVANEGSGTTTIFDIAAQALGEPDFTLELLHFTDQEANASTIGNIDNLSAVLSALREQDVGADGAPDNTITLSSGDVIIPGLFFDASEAVFGAAGIADVQIQNELGLEAAALGNHEFDLGTSFLAGLIDGSAQGDFAALSGTAIDGEDFAGAAFPYLSANLGFATDPNLAPLEAAGGQAPAPGVVTSSVVIEKGGEPIGVVGATVPTIDTISSAGADIGIFPEDFDSSPTDAQIDALATVIQAEVDALLAANPDVNKVIMLAHMQQISIELALAERLEGVDIIVAGGSNTRLFDGDDRIRDGDSDQGDYPQEVTNAGGSTTLVVNTDAQYKYVGRLVIDFDAEGRIIPDSYDDAISGAYATDDLGVVELAFERFAPFAMTEDQQVDTMPPDTAATGAVTLDAIDGSTGVVTISGSFEGLKAADPDNALAPVGAVDTEGNPQSAIHLHGAASGANGPIVRNFTVTDNGDGSGVFSGVFTLTPAELAALIAGETYVNLHTTDFVAGQLRGQVDIPAAVEASGLIDPEVDAITDVIQAQIVATESNVFGVSDVFLNGNRSGDMDDPSDPDGVRTQETNLGNLTADANLIYANQMIAAGSLGDPVVVSIKNGGGIRANIGAIVVPAGGTEAERLPNEQVVDGDGVVVKPQGGVSQNDIASTLAFNNGLTLLDVTKAELVATLEEGVGALPDVSGGFPQVAGVRFSFDPDLPSGGRIVSAAIVDEAGVITDELVRDGQIVGDADEVFRIVTLNFLANGGDPVLSALSNPNRVDLIDLDADGVDDGAATGAATFADDGSEQDALAEYLNETFNPATGGAPFDEGDTGRNEDARIQNLSFRVDAVFGDVAPAPSVVITEIMQNPAAVSDALGEYFEIFNAGDAPVDIDGWTIRDDDVDSHVIDAGGALEIAPGAYALLARNGDMATNGGLTPIYAYGDDISLANGSDEIVLETAAGDLVDAVAYDDGATFPDPNGASMGLLDPALDNAVGANWSVSATPFGDGDLGTPGAPNGTAAAFDLQITEIWPGQDGDDVTEDWFEIANVGAAAWSAGADADLFYDDESMDAGAADPIEGLTSLSPGERAIVVIGGEVDAAAFREIWGAVIDLADVQVGWSDGAGLSGGGDAVTLFVGGPSAEAIVDVEGYPDTEGFDAASYDVAAAAFSIAGQNGAVATAALGGAGADTPATGSPGDGAPVGVAPTPIFAIQGAGHVSPLLGQSVLASGVVTAVDSNGFYLQDPEGDGDIATSDALFVFTGAAPEVAVGDAVDVTGVVGEFTPGGADSGNLSTTQIGEVAAVVVTSSGNPVPAAAIIGAAGRIAPDVSIDDDAFTSFDPETDGADFFESLEGMLVTATDLVAVSGTNRFGEIFAVADQGANASGLSSRGTLNISPGDFNPEKIQIDEDSGVFDFDFPQVDVGDFLGDVTGVVGYSFGNFEVVPTVDFTGQIVDGDLAPDATAIEGDADTLTVAAYNVLNLDPNDADGDSDVADGRFGAIAAQIVGALNAPDVIGLQEVQDNDGSEDSGMVSASETLATLVDAIAAAGGPDYAVIDNTFIGDGLSGGQPGGNIRTAFLYNPERVSLVEGSVGPIGGQGEGEAFEGARLPLTATFAFGDEQVTVVNNHFSSKGGSSPIVGVEQPFEARQEEVLVNGSLDERQAQSAAVAAFVRAALDDDPDADIVVLGDLNEFEFVSPVTGLEAAGLTNLTGTAPEDERYSFIFQGNSQSLDHILVSDGLLETAAFDFVHVNSEFAETPQRASDHDPLVASFDFDAPEGKTVTLVAGASSAPEQSVSFEVVINGVSFGRSTFAETTNAASDFRANAPMERFEFRTDFDEIDEVAVIFADDAGPSVNDGFDVNILVDSAIISGGDHPDQVLAPTENGFYDAAADRGFAANSGGMFWNGELTLSNPEALLA